MDFHPLDDPLHKMHRAESHLQELNREVVAYQRGHTYTIKKDLDANRSRYIYRIEPNQLPPYVIGTIIGDAVHNMRSALDHLAWQLSLLTTSTPYRRTEFPIYKDLTEQSVRDVRRKIQDIPPEAAALIEQLQPYNQGENAVDHPLWILHALWNTDKHVSLVPVSHAGWIPIFLGEGGSYEIDGNSIVVAVPIEVDAELALEDRITPDVAFPLNGPGRGGKVLDILGAIHEALDTLVFPVLSGFFPESTPRRVSVSMVRQDTPPTPRE